MKATVTTSSGMIALALNAKGRNRSVYEDKLISSIDPDGIHVMGFSFPHNDVEMRTQWFVKIQDTDEPAEIWLDVDFDVLDRHTTGVDTSKGSSDEDG